MNSDFIWFIVLFLMSLGNIYLGYFFLNPSFTKKYNMIVGPLVMILSLINLYMWIKNVE